ncbi:Asp23/Gls24 family envelope stress response protein [Rhodococcus sp. NPDC058521]|uniref:Asp23/Gls24 family envelope stress response protein n=1 Tax=Rhodococcus sp. NPDC058521 TaxID=3346536 RepID=UPI00366822DF
MSEAPSTDEPGGRGQLAIKERVIARIATTAALRVPGVVRASGSLLRFTHRDLPRADVTIGARAVAINLYVAVEWPCRLDVLDSRLQRDVNEQVEFMTGLPVHSLHVIVADTRRVRHNTGLDDSAVDDSAVDRDAMPPAHTTTTPAHSPRAKPVAAPVASVVAVLALALSVITARELLIEGEQYSGAPWIRNTFEWLGRLHWSGWLVPVAAASVAIGALFVVCALVPRRRTHRGVHSEEDAETVVWLRPIDLARRASDRALTVPRVTTAETTVRRTRLTVRVTCDERDGEHTDPEVAVRSAFEPDLSILTHTPTLRVKVTE